MQKTVRTGLVRTNENCVGCNKCIRSCSCAGASVAGHTEDGRNIIHVDGSRCISCGACMDVCVHEAREYVDDTDEFFEDLAKGEKISLLIAPAFFAGYPKEAGSILGGLRALGVNRMVSVGFGADITTWGYINYIQKYHFTGGISQPCPAVVSYIERYIPELIPRLIPIQSPMLCAAIYARNEMKIADKFAFISPCIAKKSEMNSKRGEGLISYNVTFEKLLKYVREHNISGPSVEDEIEYGMGSIYPMTGGLKENIYWFMGEDAFVRQIEGEKNVYKFLEHNKEEIRTGAQDYLMIEALNCAQGCIYGTAVEKQKSREENIYAELLHIRRAVKQDRDLSPAQRLDKLNQQFAHLKLEDYMCTYTDGSGTVKRKEPTEQELEEIYQAMNKETAESRQINCASCGYETCREMAVAIYNGYNYKDNCIYYVREEAEREKDKRRKAEIYKELAMRDVQTGLFNRNAYYAWLNRTEDYEGKAIIIFDLNELKRCNDTLGHEMGDKYINSAAQLISRVFAEHGTTYRIGGDEFCTVLEHSDGRYIDKKLKELTGLEKEFNDRNEKIHMQIARGYAFYRDDLDADFSETQKRADANMYRNKLILKKKNIFDQNQNKKF